MERKTLFVDVIFPLSLPRAYTYRVPFEMNDLVGIGKRVVVQLGKNKIYTAIVSDIHEQPPANYEAKYIDSVLDNQSIVNSFQLQLWQWMANYYMCTVGEVMNAALPSGLKLSSETKIVLHPVFSELEENEKVNITEQLDDKGFLLTEALIINNSLTLQEVSQITGLKKVYSLVNTLLEKQIVLVEEELKQRYKPKTESYVRLTQYASDEKNLKLIFQQLEKRAFKQLELLMHFIKNSEPFSSSPKELKKSELLNSAFSQSQLNELIKKDVLEVYLRSVDRLGTFGSGGKTVELSAHQETAFEKVKADFERMDVVLLQGITASGKTELYVKLIEEQLAAGKQVLFLLPEIALTAQIINRLRKFFGEAVGVYHSKFNENERVEIWNKLISSELENDFKKYRLIVGARSALFLPFENLGLVIVDEEHDTAYKQQDPAPRYNARDSAIFLAHLHKAKTLLGSATPSVESYQNALQNKFGFAQLTERYGGAELPEILIADVKEAKKLKLMKSHFSPLLLDNISDALENKEQIILFQNRRGFAPMLECNLCAWVPQCTQCDVSLTYHKQINLLKCHYCGYAIQPVQSCGACGSNEMLLKGFGTEKIEEELSIFFPNSKIARLDFDTTRSKHAYHQLLQSFEDREIDILVGTQMVTKGLDFENVSIVGVLNADNMLHYPDFRSYERSFQLMAQVSGRAGRKAKRGKVIIQTQSPQHPILKTVIENSWENFYAAQIQDRQQFKYPPFYRLIKITLKHKDANTVANASADMAQQLRDYFGVRILGPESPSVARIRNYFLKSILIKLEKEISLQVSKQKIAQISGIVKEMQGNKSLLIVFDVDPI